MKKTLLALIAGLGIAAFATPVLAQDAPAGGDQPAEGAPAKKHHHKKKKADDAAAAGEAGADSGAAPAKKHHHKKKKAEEAAPAPAAN